MVTETDNETQSANEGNMHNEADVGASQQSMSRDTEGLTDEEKDIYIRITSLGKRSATSTAKGQQKELNVEVKKLNQALKKLSQRE